MLASAISKMLAIIISKILAVIIFLNVDNYVFFVSGYAGKCDFRKAEIPNFEMLAIAYSKMPTSRFSPMLTIRIPRYAGKCSFRDAGNYYFRNAGNHNFPKVWLALIIF